MTFKYNDSPSTVFNKAQAEEPSGIANTMSCASFPPPKSSPRQEGERQKLRLCGAAATPAAKVSGAVTMLSGPLISNRVSTFWINKTFQTRLAL